ncbi:hypothetical protein [Algoriphagus confluentis]|uniref:Uncharacterized protein n=1 Tax=Algoriphagus confluentis TaxID=1697556 RepID=A0ABQ6PMQ2_9BACT|nr:hypothetical protein Aconfl_18920 [Algoriphagus confluentis]
MKSFSKFLIPSAIALIFLQNCNPKEEIPSVSTVWERAEGFGLDPLLGSNLLNQKLFVTSESGRYPNATLDGPNDFQGFGIEQNAPGRYRFPSSDKVVASRNDNFIVLEAPKNVGLTGKGLRYNMKEIDPDFQYFFDLPYFFSDAIGIDKNGTVLIPYHSASNGFAKSSPDFLLFKTKLVDGELEVLELKLIKENFIQGMNSVTRVNSFDNFFQIRIGPDTYNIGEDEKPKLKHEHLTKSFQFGSEIISFGALFGQSSPLYAYRSDLNGQNTQLINTFDDPSILQLEFTIVDGRIIGYGNSQLFLIDLQENNIKITELDNTGLEGSFITSVTMADANRVLVTSAPIPGFDLAGGFYKPLEELFKPRVTATQ